MISPPLSYFVCGISWCAHVMQESVQCVCVYTINLHTKSINHSMIHTLSHDFQVKLARGGPSRSLCVRALNDFTAPLPRPFSPFGSLGIGGGNRRTVYAVLSWWQYWLCGFDLQDTVPCQKFPEQFCISSICDTFGTHNPRQSFTTLAQVAELSTD